MFNRIYTNIQTAKKRMMWLTTNKIVISLYLLDCLSWHYCLFCMNGFCNIDSIYVNPHFYTSLNSLHIFFPNTRSAVSPIYIPLKAPALYNKIQKQ